MVLDITLLLLGFVLLIIGANWLVDGSSSLARKFKVSDLAIGLTVVAFGTSTPELVVNLFAAVEGHNDIVFGNILGSNNFNLFIILGIAGLITPLVVKSSTVWTEIPLSMAALILLFLLANDFFIAERNLLSRLDGIILLALFVFFLYYVFRHVKADIEVHRDFKEISTPKIIALIILGLGGLIAGGRVVVINAVDLAKDMGVSEKIIGLTIVAAGTSLPELVTSVIAGIKKNNDIAIGNIVGSNIFNIFFILGLSSLLRPQEYNTAFNTDIYMVAFGTVFLFTAMFLGKKHRLDRWEAGVLLLIYIGYTLFLIKKEI
ncbi:MAG: calcium/sodium antiporter [Bacteroidales bacterium]|jgi:cation:H+ antiporter|nr:calcium/sodium antiporter [Bacteroidales bacterium]